MKDFVGNFITEIKKNGIDITFSNFHKIYRDTLKELLDTSNISLVNEECLMGESIYNYPFSEIIFIQENSKFYFLTIEEYLKNNKINPYTRQTIVNQKYYDFLVKDLNSNHKSLTFEENWKNILKRNLNFSFIGNTA